MQKQAVETLSRLVSCHPGPNNPGEGKELFVHGVEPSRGGPLSQQALAKSCSVPMDSTIQLVDVDGYQPRRGTPPSLGPRHSTWQGADPTGTDGHPSPTSTRSMMTASRKGLWRLVFLCCTCSMSSFGLFSTIFRAPLSPFFCFKVFSSPHVLLLDSFRANKMFLYYSHDLKKENDPKRHLLLISEN